MKILYAILVATFLATNIYASEMSDVNKCISINDSGERLKCYDSVFRANLIDNSKIEVPKSTVFSDVNDAVRIEILNILDGEGAVENSKISRHQLIRAQQVGKKIIYFSLKVTNNKYDGELHVLPIYFKLETVDGETFSSVPTNDWIRGNLHRERNVRGGVSFEIYPDSVPKVLRYKTGLKNGLGIDLEAISPDLSVKQ